MDIFRRGGLSCFLRFLRTKHGEFSMKDSVGINNVLCNEHCNTHNAAHRNKGWYLCSL